ncbi:MAG: efflux RND transporter periplasmic adaptor subunit [Gammaproteobacteria bacterium]
MNEPSAKRDPDLNATLGLGQEARGRRWGPWLLAAAALILAVLGATWWLSEPTTGYRYLTAPASEGPLTVTVTATGTLQPVNQVDVGTEISGTVKSVAVDYNDHVKVGQELARLDTDQLEAKDRQAQAALELAKARVQSAKATVVETRAKLARVTSLIKKGMASPDDRDTARAAYARATADLEVANAQVSQAQAQVDADRTTLAKAVIHSPINGIVLNRNVEPGQTVAASLQTPVLFVLAENLAQMELDVAVDEADVGQVKEGQHATFTVDAYPNRQYEAVVRQVRYAPQTVAGVVTYDTVLGVDNSDLTLRPGMTATVDITVQHIDHALLVPNAALRFTPPQLIARSGRRNMFSRLIPHRPPQPKNQTSKQTLPSGHKRIWILRNGAPTPASVAIGATDGKMTVVTSDNLKPGTPVVVDYQKITK